MSIATELELIKLKLAQAEIMEAQVSDDALIVDLMDGRTVSAPIVWFPRLAYGTPEERNHFEILRIVFIGRIWMKTLASRHYYSGGG